MKYRVGSLSQSLEDIRSWARLIADKHKVQVRIYIIEERLFDCVDPRDA